MINNSRFTTDDIDNHYKKLVALAECEANQILNNLILICHRKA